MEGNPIGEEAPSTVAGVMSREQFFAAFKAVLALPPGISGAIGGPPLASLPVRPEEEPAARACADAIYDTAMDVPQLRWLIEPGNKWLARTVAIGAFTIPKALAVRAELAAWRAERRPAPRTEPAAAPAPEAGPEPPPAPAAPRHVDMQVVGGQAA